MADQKDLVLLFERYLAGNCSEKETETLFSLFNEPNNDEILRKLIKEALDADAVDPSFQKRVKQITQQAETNIIEAIRSEAKPETTVRFTWRNTLQIAATLLFICTAGIGLYLLNHENSKKENRQAITEFGPDIEPGGHRATLSLGNGDVISLSGEQSGIISGDSLKYTDGSSITAEQAPNQNYVLTTPKGGQYSVVLSDGTKVWLNAESSLSYPVQFVGKERRVELIGEAYFEVSHDVKPFIVSSDQQEIKVLGTHFNVNAYRDQSFTMTTLVNGSVEVIDRKTRSSGRLVPGNQSKVQDGKIDIQQVDVTPYVSWREGLFSFRETELHEVLNRIGRWYDVEIIYEQKMPPTHFFGDIKRNENLASVLSILKQSGMNFRIEKNDDKNKLIVLP